jgi:hypothetical protein
VLPFDGVVVFFVLLLCFVAEDALVEVVFTAFFGAVTLIVFFSKVIPHLGQLPGLLICTSGCIGQVYITFCVCCVVCFLGIFIPGISCAVVTEYRAITNAIRIILFIFLILLLATLFISDKQKFKNLHYSFANTFHLI